MSYATARRRDVNSEINKLYPEDRTVHEWYRFVLSFPPHLVREYLTRFGLDSRHLVLDPFCGTGTVLVESKKLGIPSVGVEANPMAYFASRVKANWDIDPDGLVAHARGIADCASAHLAENEIEDSPLFGMQADQSRPIQTLPGEQDELLLTGSMSTLPLHKTLVLLEHLEAYRDSPYYDLERLALAKAVVFSASNLHFGPEVGVGPAKLDAPVMAPWLTNVLGMANDLRAVQDRAETPARVYYADARDIAHVTPPNSIDAVFTSPPYPNEKDYTRTTRLESVLLGFIQSKADLRASSRACSAPTRAMSIKAMTTTGLSRRILPFNSSRTRLRRGALN